MTWNFVFLYARRGCVECTHCAPSFPKYHQTKRKNVTVRVSSCVLVWLQNFTKQTVSNSTSHKLFCRKSWQRIYLPVKSSRDVLCSRRHQEIKYVQEKLKAETIIMWMWHEQQFPLTATHTETQNWRYRNSAGKRWHDAYKHDQIGTFHPTSSPSLSFRSFVRLICFLRYSIACKKANLRNSVFMCVVSRFHLFHQFRIHPFFTLEFQQVSNSCANTVRVRLMLWRLRSVQAHAWRQIGLDIFTLNINRELVNRDAEFTRLLNQYFQSSTANAVRCIQYLALIARTSIAKSCVECSALASPTTEFQFRISKTGSPCFLRTPKQGNYRPYKLKYLCAPVL